MKDEKRGTRRRPRRACFCSSFILHPSSFAPLLAAAARAAAAGPRAAASSAGRKRLDEALRELEALFSSRQAPPSLRAAYDDAVDGLKAAERREAMVRAADIRRRIPAANELHLNL
ncbi:MAG TPA: hypothetical protein VND64_07840 [Pirellulales bacterium]|nr:hypothetical protein [Pirellulales bacterium]